MSTTAKRHRKQAAKTKPAVPVLPVEQALTSVTRPDRPTGAPVDTLEFVMGSQTHDVDEENGIIKHVKILGERSVNRRLYPQSTRSAALHLYEGQRTNVDHPPRQSPDMERSFDDWCGWLEGCTDEPDGIYGDLHLLLSHPQASKILEAAKKRPMLFGLSHNSVNFYTPHEGVLICTAIEKVRSVDVVCKPATTQGIFESEDPTMATAMAPEKKAACEDELPTDPAMGMEEGPPGEEAGGEPGDMIKQKFLEMVSDIFDGDGTPQEKGQAFKDLGQKLCKVHGDLTAVLNGDDESEEGEGDGEGSEVPEDDEESAEPDKGNADGKKPASKPANESEDPAVLKAEITKLKRRDQAREALESAGIVAADPKARAAQVSAVAALESEDEQKALIATWGKSPNGAPVAKPKSRPANALESSAGAAAPDKPKWEDPAWAARQLHRRN